MRSRGTKFNAINSTNNQQGTITYRFNLEIKRAFKADAPFNASNYSEQAHLYRFDCKSLIGRKHVLGVKTK